MFAVTFQEKVTALWYPHLHSQPWPAVCTNIMCIYIYIYIMFIAYAYVYASVCIIYIYIYIYIYM